MTPLLHERRGPVAWLTLNRPPGNAIDVPLARALMEAANACDEDRAVRCVVLTGQGRMFCAGGDVAGFAAAGDAMPALTKELTAYLHTALSRLARMDKPLVTAINGPVAGGGLGLALLGDVALAARSAHFTMAYTALGLTPDGGSTWLLPRLVGLRRAQEMALLNTRLDAEQAAAWGLISRVVEDAALPAEADALARRLAAGPTAALGRTRALLASSLGAGFETQMEMEARAIADTSRGADAREGVRAFMEKRPPRFDGPEGA